MLLPHVPNQDMRLLSASNTAYQITQSGPVDFEQDYYSVTFIEGPVGFAHGIEKMDAVLLGVTNHEIILAFRGTSPKLLIDWANDLNCPLIPFVKGKAHQGFAGSLNDLWTYFADPLIELLRKYKDKPLAITGHSKGGALAYLAALQIGTFLSGDLGGRNMTIRSFAAARPGDGDLAKAVLSVTSDIRRYEYGDDIVPHLPPDTDFAEILKKAAFLPEALRNFIPLGYESVGPLYYITKDKKTLIENDPVKAGLVRFAAFAELVLKSEWADLLKDHSHSKDGGYAAILERLKDSV